jgi:hypothetical protein
MLAIVVAVVGCVGLGAVGGGADVYADAPQNAIEISGTPYTDSNTITADDVIPFLSSKDGEVLGKIYSINLTQNVPCDIRMVSNDFEDALVYVFLSTDTTNPKYVETPWQGYYKTNFIGKFTPEVNGTYYIVATNYKSEIGSYSLSVNPATTTISGTVSGSASLQNVLVQAYIGIVESGDEEPTYYKAPFTSTWTNADGEYTIKGLENGDYKLEFSDITGKYMTQYYESAFSLDEAEPITIESSLPVSGIDIQLTDAGKISGTVTDSGSQPVFNVVVRAYTYDEEFDEWVKASELDMFASDHDGTYTVGGLSTGDYKLEFEYEGGWSTYITQYYSGKSTLEDANTVPVTLGATTPDIDVTLAQKGKISGTVTNSEEDELEGIYVSAYTYNAEYGGWYDVSGIYTDSNGEYTITDLNPGEYKVQFRDDAQSNYVMQFYDGESTLETADIIEVAAEETTEGIDATLVIGGTISGTVQNSSQENLDGISVIVYTNYGSGWVMVSQANTSDGAYTIGGLGAGDYKIKFYDQSGTYMTQYYDGESTLSAADTVAVTAGQTTEDIDATLASGGGSISGTITGVGKDMQRAVVVMAYLYDGTDNDWMLYDGISQAFNSNGENFVDEIPYTISNLTPGNYKIRFMEYYEQYTTQFYNNSATVVSATLVKVENGETTSDIDAHLSPNTLTVSAGTGGRIITTNVNEPCRPGTQVKITAKADEGYTFSGWKSSNGGTFANAASRSTTFTMPENPTAVTANFTKDTSALTISAGAGGKITAGTSGQYAPGATVNITATPNTGYKFSGWTTSNGGSFANAASASTAFTMPANATTVTANFTVATATSTLNIVAGTGGKITAGANGQYAPGAKVNITATPNAGYKFAGWKSSNGGSFTNAASASTVFTMPANAATVTANFTKNAVSATAITAGTFGKIKDKAWTGKQLKPTVSVKVKGATLRNGTDYTVTYGANKKIGKGAVTIKAKVGSAYTGSKVLTFKIVPKKPTKVALKPGKNQIKVSFKPVTKAQGVTKYTVQYKLKGAKSWKSKTLSVKSKAKSASITLKKLKKGKTYQVRVSAVKTVSKVKYASAWTAIKTSKKVK